MNAYENLYQNMKKSFTVANGNCEYTLGGYMRYKAHELSKDTSLPEAITKEKPGALRTLISYVNDKLTVKEAPVPEKTMKAFPFRTSFAACLCAVLLCTLLFSYALMNSGVASTGPDSYVVEYQAEQEDETLLAMEEEK